MADVVYGIGLDASGVLKEVKNVKSSEKQLQDQLKKTNKRLGDQEKSFKKVNSIGKKWSADLKSMVGAYIGLRAGFAVLKSAIKTNIDFEQSLADVRAVMQPTAKEFSKMSKVIRDQAKVTEFTAVQTSQGMQFLAMAGLDATTSMKALPGVLQLASAGALSMADAANISTNIMSAMRLEAEDLAKVNDTLAFTASNSNTNIQQLGEAFRVTAGIASATNQSLSDVSTLLGAMANRGLQGANAGEKVKQMLTRLIKPSGAAADTLKRLNVETRTASGEMRPLTDIMKDLAKAGLSGGDAIDIFGKFTASAALSVVGAIPDINKLETGLKGATGSAKEMAETRLDTTAGDVKLLGSAWEEFTIAIFEGNGFIRTSIQTLTSLIKLLTPTSTALENTTESSQKQRAEFSLLATSYNELSKKTNKTKEETEVLNTSYSKLQKLYPDYLGNLSDEKDNYEEIQQALKLINIDLAEKAKLAAKAAIEKDTQEELAEIYQESIELTKALLKEKNTLAQAEKLHADKVKGYNEDSIRDESGIIEQREESALRISQINKKIEAQKEKQRLVLIEAEKTKKAYDEMFNTATSYVSDELKSQHEHLKELEAIEARRRGEDKAYESTRKTTSVGTEVKALNFEINELNTNFRHVKDTVDTIDLNEFTGTAIGNFDRFNIKLNETERVTKKLTETMSGIGTNALKAFFVAGVKGTNALEAGFNALKNAVLDLAATLAAKAAIFGILSAVGLGPAGGIMKFLGFADGVVGFNGAGTGKSDSNLAMISNGESVMTARATRMFAPMLASMEQAASGKVNYGGNVRHSYAEGSIGIQSSGGNNSSLIAEVRSLKNQVMLSNNLTTKAVQGLDLLGGVSLAGDKDVALMVNKGNVKLNQIG